MRQQRTEDEAADDGKDPRGHARNESDFEVVTFVRFNDAFPCHLMVNKNDGYYQIRNDQCTVGSNHGV